MGVGYGGPGGPGRPLRPLFGLRRSTKMSKKIIDTTRRAKINARELSIIYFHEKIFTLW